MSASAPTLSAVPQHKGSSLPANFIWNFVGAAVNTTGQWITLVLLAKLTSPELVGQYILGFAIVFPVLMLANLQLRVAVVSDIYQRIDFGHYLSLRLLTTGLALLIIVGITQILEYRWQLSAVVLMVGVAQAIEAVSDIHYARLQLRDRMDRISKSLIARTLLAAIGLTVGVYLGEKLLWGITGIVLARVIVLLGYDIRERTHGLAKQSKGFTRNEGLKPRWDLRVQRQLLWFNSPLGIILVLVSLNSSIPRYFIGYVLGERELGIFAAIASVFAAGSMVVVSLGESAFTRLARFYATENLVEFRLLLGKLLTSGAAMGVCGIVLAKLAGREILTILFRPEYAERADLLPWMMVVGSVAYMAQFLGYGMTAARYYHSQIVLFVLTNLSVAVASYALIPRQGLLGAILAMLIATLVQFIGSVIILVRGMRKHAGVCAQNVEAVPPDVFVQA